jgi:hypothetical protein
MEGGERNRERERERDSPSLKLPYIFQSSRSAMKQTLNTNDIIRSGILFIYAK